MAGNHKIYYGSQLNFKLVKKSRNLTQILSLHLNFDYILKMVLIILGMMYLKLQKPSV